MTFYLTAARKNSLLCTLNQSARLSFVTELVSDWTSVTFFTLVANLSVMILPALATAQLVANSTFYKIGSFLPMGKAFFPSSASANFMQKFNPLIELKNKALQFLCVPIPPSALTPDLVQLFNESKECILSSPILAGYDPDLPLFLKTDWSASGMSWILMQPARDEESLAAVTTLRETGKNLFDLSPSRPRLLPLSFGSRACSHSEQHWHSFVGEAGTKFLWGLVHPFYWMCDCLAMKEIFKYNGSNSQIARWAQ